MKPILPGATIGLLGGGQLGRMTALAAVSMGYKIRAIDPDPECPIRPLAEECITAPWHDAEAFARLARGCDVVTYEIEKIPKTSLDQVERFAPLRPGAHVLRIVQDRLKQKEWLSRHGFPVARFLGIRSADDVLIASGAFRGPGFLKTTQGGYDGRSQIRIPDASHLAEAWKDLGELPCVLESAIPFECELSVLVARQETGETVTYEPSLNSHRAGILDWAVLPSDLAAEISRGAQELARSIAEKIDLGGLLVAEMFKLPNGDLLVNELAPRPHNSYHSSERACVTGQFEQLVRAICGLPLGMSNVVRPAAIANLLGDLWHDSVLPGVSEALQVPETRIHLYGKASARPGRKMGHVSATGDTWKEALDRALLAYQKISGGVVDISDSLDSLQSS